MPRKFLTAWLLTASFCSGQSTPAQTLALSQTQIAAIQQLNADYNKVWQSEQSRISGLNTELNSLLARQNTDPRELGLRAVSLELIRRERVANQTAVQTKIAALLTASQAATLQTLISSVILQPVASSASCAFLLPQTPHYWFDTSYPSGITGAFSFSTFFLSNALPFIPPAPTGSFCGSQIFPVSVRQYLNLTDAQVAFLYSASTDYNNYYERQQNRLTDLRLEIEDLMARPGVDPVLLGLRYAEIAKIGQQIQAKYAQLRDAAQTQLTPAQSIQLKTLKDSQDLSVSGSLGRLVDCNLLVLPEGAGAVQTGLTLGGYSSCFL